MITSTLLANNFWTKIINFFGNWVGNYGWAIIVFAIILKLVMSPLDIFQRISTGKQSRMMSAMQPELDEIKKKYANNPERLNQEQNKLYKKYQTNAGGMCFTMLITIGLTMVIFFTLYASLRSYGNEKLYESYRSLDSAYVQAENECNVDWSEDEKVEYIAVKVKEQYATQQKQNKWLWVKNVWKSDTKTSQFVNFDDYAKHMKLSDEEKQIVKTRYDAIIKTIDGEKTAQNGYYILIIACAVISFLTQLLSTKLLQQKQQKMTLMNKIMMLVLPISMLIFAWTSNAMFTLYIITNSVMTTIISTIISLIINHKNKGKTDEEVLLKKKNIEVVEYSRNYKK